MDLFELHPVKGTLTYIEVILPIAVPQTYTYQVPEVLIPYIQFGIRVEVQFGKQKLYAAVVVDIHQNKPEMYKPKLVLSVIDDAPIIHPKQLELWKWMAKYYNCTLGELMNAALPGNLKLSSETRLIPSPLFDKNYEHLNDKEYLIVEALSIQEEISIDDVRKILGQQTVYPLVRSMLEKRLIYLKEDLKQKYKPKKIACVRLQEPYRSQPETLQKAFELVGRADRQMEALMAYLQLVKKEEYVYKQAIYKAANVKSTIINALVKKGIFEIYDKEVSRIAGFEEEQITMGELSEQQEQAVSSIKTHFEANKPVLLHGVTGSGKTRVYLELIRAAIEKGEQVLYLLPEIALTTQLIVRLQKVLGDEVAIYHSKLNNNERVEMWKAVLNGKPVLMGARSGLFLPFNNLKLIIVDEEHDPSFKQTDPNPRYNGRDIALVMAQLHGANVILGTATPAIETYYNTTIGKYALVEMKERFGGIAMPNIIVVDAKQEMKERKLQSHFTSVLLDELKATLERGEQAILFQNRRGYAPTYRCTTCGWHSECIHCDVSLTYHKFHNNLKCHYCGYTVPKPTVCGACGSPQLTLKGFGTEKIEDELKIYLPDAKIGRMDLDTVRTRNAHAKIINDFEEKRFDILVGTQMVTKGLDFDNVSVVGVLSADTLLQFPDFRATERAFQLLTQVSGRAGRRKKQGKVIIQAFNTTHPTLQEVVNNDYAHFFQRELAERQAFSYPPFNRLIKITLKHKKPQTLNEATQIFDKLLKSKLGDWVIGPAIPYISRVRSYYLFNFLIKLGQSGKKIRYAKTVVQDAVIHLHQTPGYSGVRINVDVDPY